jgi:pyruvate formate-lyase/glycerol dehydratase family glycyl radical enzyme
MNERVRRLHDQLAVSELPVCVEKACLIVESLRQTEGEPQIVRRAKATAHYLDHKTVFIDDGELIVGNVASKPMGLEAGSLGPTWPEDDWDDLRHSGLSISDEDMATLRSFDDYWRGKGRTLEERRGQFYDDERLWPFIRSGILCPPWTSKTEGRGQGAAGVGWGLGLGDCLIVVDYAKVLNEGLDSLIREAEEESRRLRYVSADDITKGDFLRSLLIAIPAIVRLADRFGDMAEVMAAQEADSARRSELETIAESCHWVPRNPARTFREAMQSFWFIWMMICSGTAPGGRFDQFMYPFYEADKAAGSIGKEEALELLECLRLKVMQYNFVGGGKQQRAKWSGMARWHNWVIGGVTPAGDDATNDLSFLILEAARRCPTPHHTITVRVHDGTPEALMQKAMEVAKLGLGMPAFVSDKSYIGYLTGQGVSLEEARDYAIAGCLDVNLPGKSRINAVGMFIVPRVLEIALNNGFDPHLGLQLGPRTGAFEDFGSFEAFMEAFKTQLKYFMSLTAEEHNITLMAHRELLPDVVHSSLMVDAIEVGKDALNRILPFENGSALNMVGMINVADSLAAIRKLVFDENKITKREMMRALKANWDGFEEIHELCVAAPKYGNGIPFVDGIARDLFRFWEETASRFTTAWGGTIKPTGISITAHAPGGMLTGATPDGRYAGETLADGSVSPAQGRDTDGPTAVMRSAMAVDQEPYQATLLNLKFHPSALQSDEDLSKLSALIRAYLSAGGKHVQFNVIGKETLRDAQEHPERHRDLIVRVAGYSAYYTRLTRQVQDEIIARTEQGEQA